MTAKAKMRPSAPPEEIVEYDVDIIDWHWVYSLSLISWNHGDDDPYREGRHLKIIGKLLRPAGLGTEVVHITLLPSSGMSEERRKDSNPNALGVLELYPNVIRCSVGIPADVLSPILQMLIAKKLSVVQLKGSKFHKRSARLIGLRLKMRFSDTTPMDIVL